MQVFISSVRRGLDEERDALPGLITALGHTPLAFEDFTTRSVPSRQACVDGVKAADAYVLLIGPHYGHRFEDTGQSPTHDEWVTAQQTGIPRLVFLKDGVEMDDDQREFYRSISNYISGVFYNSFTSTADLLTKVAAAIRELEKAPRPLTWSPLNGPVTPGWRRDFDPQANSRYASSLQAQLELHVLGQPAQPRSARQTGELAPVLAARVRSAGLVDDAQPVHVNQSEDGSLLIAIPAAPPSGRAGLQRVYPTGVTGLRVAGDGQVSIWGSLPADTMGSVVDPDDLSVQLADLLRMVGSLNLIDREAVAIAVGIDNISMLSSGRVTELPRSQATFLSTSQEPLHLPPDELVSIAALGTGAVEAARPLAHALIEATRRRR
ncbi:DUF4062 domain-containing protein [uncultured Jatrophihabitans sp.]|uniref:DUF4062 domain-containing protein n=1 Tax=uncultured Jatrophihabitans sp. TaxID=1610747 RepID=UPI0035CAD101